MAGARRRGKSASVPVSDSTGGGGGSEERAEESGALAPDPSPPRVIDGVEIPLDEKGVPLTARHFNSPPTDFYMHNSRGERIHIRWWLPPSPEETRLCLFQLHGYAAHVNGPTFGRLSREMCAAGMAVVSMDMVGHGYSEGERCYIESWDHWLEDCSNLMKLFLLEGCETSNFKAFLGIDHELWGAFFRSTPFAITGISQGGALSLHTGLRIQRGNVLPKDRFLGTFVMCPAIRASLPPKPVYWFLKYVVAWLFPRMMVPTFLERVNGPDLMWTNETSVIRSKLDRWGQIGGLAWGWPMRFGMAVQIIGLMQALESQLHLVDFPFAVAHDPEDAIVHYKGTELLLRHASTPLETHRGRELHLMRKKKHDLISNCPEEMVALMKDWILDQLEHQQQDD